MTRIVSLNVGLAAILLVAGTVSADNTGQVVKTENGPVSGTVSSTGRQFLGIPYAAPPVGPLRWKPPTAPQNWTANRDATHVSSTCPQPASPFGIASTNEDCLYLNVYTPRVGAAGGALRNDPVLVWIHPGAFQFGEGSDFNPRQLVARNIVVVTINYRLGALGFLAHPALTAEGAGTSGNYGFQDQQAALGWVKRNIAQFGGNPNKVTIAGQSAGGLSVHAHLVAPGSAGLFQQAIVESGAYTLTPPTLAQAETVGTAYAAAVGCSSGDAACLRAVSVTNLIGAQDPNNPAAYLPRVDGKILPTTMAAAFASGQFNKVHVIEGSAHDEYTLFTGLLNLQGVTVTADNYGALIANTLQLPAAAATQVVPLVIQQYPLANYANGELALAAVGTDAIFACGAANAANLLQAQTPTWWYEFDDPDAPQYLLPPVGYPYGSFHGAELPYLFDVRQTVPAPALDADQQQLSDAMVKHWSNFARLGNPNALTENLWPRFQPPTTQRVQQLTPPQPQPYTATAFVADHKCDFWAQLAAAGSQ
jgi:para-nitrobenzyl esterase